MTLERLSKKQRKLLKWCHSKNEEKYNAIICDGAVRSGKTVVMTVSFIHWAMKNFNNANFAICGKTISSAERNIIMPARQLTDITGFFEITYSRSNGVMTLCGNGKKNDFYIFGGKDESSYALIQGMTLCGVLFDEVALMPRSFVEQAVARTLSESRAKLWFNCNPENPNHWFYREWICDADGENKKGSLHLHFLMQDNPVLTEKERSKAESLYTGIFKQRYINGEWVAAQGLVYPMFDLKKHTFDIKNGEISGEYYVSIDYGTTNPCSMGLWCVCGNTAYRVKEYYFDSKLMQKQLTDEEYYSELERLCEGKNIEYIVVDPSAASFITCIKRHGHFSVVPAKNNVTDGIRLTATLIKDGRLLFEAGCRDILREFSLYSWEDNNEKDCVKKEYDHAMDDMRYFCNTVLRFREGFAGNSSQRRQKSFAQIITSEDLTGDWGE